MPTNPQKEMTVTSGLHHQWSTTKNYGGFRLLISSPSSALESQRRMQWHAEQQNHLNLIYETEKSGANTLKSTPL